jgi:signal peptidase I
VTIERAPAGAAASGSFLDRLASPDAPSPSRAPRRPALLRLALMLAGGVLCGGLALLRLAGLGVPVPVWGSPAVLLGLGLLVSVLAERRFVAVTVRGGSMRPAFHDGDRVLVRRGPVPAVGQVVVVERPVGNGGWDRPPVAADAGAAEVSARIWMIKRVAAVPGDPVPGDQVPILAGRSGDRVPSGRLVLLGDNRAASYDSRHVGYFPAERVLGTVLRRPGRHGGPAGPLPAGPPDPGIRRTCPGGPISP